MQEFHKNLVDGIGYYRGLGDNVQNEFDELKDKMKEGLDAAENRLNNLLQQFTSKTRTVS